MSGEQGQGSPPEVIKGSPPEVINVQTVPQPPAETRVNLLTVTASKFFRDYANIWQVQLKPFVEPADQNQGRDALTTVPKTAEFLRYIRNDHSLDVVSAKGKGTLKGYLVVMEAIVGRDGQESQFYLNTKELVATVKESLAWVREVVNASQVPRVSHALDPYFDRSKIPALVVGPYLRPSEVKLLGKLTTKGKKGSLPYDGQFLVNQSTVLCLYLQRGRKAITNFRRNLLKRQSAPVSDGLEESWRNAYRFPQATSNFIKLMDAAIQSCLVTHPNNLENYARWCMLAQALLSMTPHGNFLALKQISSLFGKEKFIGTPHLQERMQRVTHIYESVPCFRLICKGGSVKMMSTEEEIPCETGGYFKLRGVAEHFTNSNDHKILLDAFSLWIQSNVQATLQYHGWTIGENWFSLGETSGKKVTVMDNIEDLG